MQIEVLLLRDFGLKVFFAQKVTKNNGVIQPTFLLEDVRYSWPFSTASTGMSTKYLVARN